MLGTNITDKQYNEIKMYISELTDSALVECLISIRAVLNKLSKEQFDKLPVAKEIEYYYDCIVDTVCNRFSKLVSKIGVSMDAFSLFADFKSSVKNYGSRKELQDKFCDKCKAKSNFRNGCDGCVIWERIVQFDSKKDS